MGYRKHLEVGVPEELKGSKAIINLSKEIDEVYEKARERIRYEIRDMNIYSFVNPSDIKKILVEIAGQIEKGTFF